ncbi:CTP synthase [Melia azedarach]|uniref:CTP synthase n=2 Tax=Melia azedarach TaxID=155640 RepID=A0ACC1YK89_MELAZ|nr:CTP synthase [Melia azedarach]KAJ4723977.1 CTP synthase [Melia azedarach]
MKSETHGKNFSPISSTQDSRSQSFTFILFSSLSIGLLILLLPHQSVDGNLVPALIFAEHQYLFNVLVISVMVSFATASSGLLIGDNPRHATISRWYFRISQISLASALLIMAFASFMEFLRLVSSGFRLWVNEDGTDSFVFQVWKKDSVRRFVLGRVMWKS